MGRARNFRFAGSSRRFVARMWMSLATRTLGRARNLRSAVASLTFVVRTSRLVARMSMFLPTRTLGKARNFRFAAASLRFVVRMPMFLPTRTLGGREPPIRGHLTHVRRADVDVLAHPDAREGKELSDPRPLRAVQSQETQGHRADLAVLAFPATRAGKNTHIPSVLAQVGAGNVFAKCCPRGSTTSNLPHDRSARGRAPQVPGHAHASDRPSRVRVRGRVCAFEVAVTFVFVRGVCQRLPSPHLPRHSSPSPSPSARTSAPRAGNTARSCH